MLNYYEMLDKTLAHYGVDAQIEQAIEELDELKEALANYMYGKDNKKNLESLKEELADVENMTRQIEKAINYKWSEKMKIANEKMKRQMKRIEEGK